MIMIGEIRDNETARIAVQAALTRAPGPIDIAHKRCGREYYKIGRYRYRAVPDSGFTERGARTAIGQEDLPRVQAGMQDIRARGPICEKGGNQAEAGLSGHWLRCLSGLQGIWGESEFTSSWLSMTSSET